MRLVAIFLLALAPHLAEASNFVVVKLSRGVELQLPKGWWVLSEQQNQVIDMAAEAAIDISEIEVVAGAEVNLITAASMPRTTYAAVRVDSIIPVSSSPSHISNLTSSDMHSVEAEIQSNLQKLLPFQGNYLLTFSGVRRVTVSGHPTLITEYRRSGSKGPVLVSIVQVFTPNQDVRISFSYRESEQAIWKSIIEKIYKSIIIRQ